MPSMPSAPSIPDSAEPGNDLVRRRAHRAATRQAFRRRAFLDALLILLAAAAIAVPVANPADSLMVGLAALSIGLLAFVVRRARDLARHVELRRAEGAALEGRGLPIAAWHAGAPLAPWPGRR